MDCSLSSTATFLESICLTLPLKDFGFEPGDLAFLGKNHNFWHRATLQLEHLLYTGDEDKSEPAQLLKNVSEVLGVLDKKILF